ncbi:30S ribosomal protein S21, partial [Candidatus Saccharibacteria bacterium]|nr:30S ribosomal protein S21 [Candidatus Saccharibacteria bacterium]
MIFDGTGGVAQLLEIKVVNRDLEKALRLLKRQIQKEGLLKELKK